MLSLSFEWRSSRAYILQGPTTITAQALMPCHGSDHLSSLLKHAQEPLRCLAQGCLANAIRTVYSDHDTHVITWLANLTKDCPIMCLALRAPISWPQLQLALNVCSNMGWISRPAHSVTAAGSPSPTFPKRMHT